MKVWSYHRTDLRNDSTSVTSARGTKIVPNIKVRDAHHDQRRDGGCGRGCRAARRAKRIFDQNPFLDPVSPTIPLGCVRSSRCNKESHQYARY